MIILKNLSILKKQPFFVILDDDDYIDLKRKRKLPDSGSVEEVVDGDSSIKQTSKVVPLS